MEQKNTGQVKWNVGLSTQKNAGPKYSRFSESLRHVTPSALQCSMFCGGRQCKYENPSKVREDETAIKGLYSAWVTDKVLAMARPSTTVITKYSIIDQFCRCGIKSVINLQHPGEHASCGFGLEESGFSYNPEDFMQADIYFYNFGWNDYGVRSLESILDMVKVMSFALQEGKAAVHCHAGLGRTGVLIACYLIYSRRISAAEAVHTVREARPKAVQTRAQIECVHDFFKFVSPSWVVFPSSHSDGKCFTLQQYLSRQKHLIHGFEARYLRYIPKIIELVCSRLLELANIRTDESSTPVDWALYSDMNRRFSEVDETVSKDSTDDHDNEQMNYVNEREDMTENPQDIKHNPFVDSIISTEAKTAILDRTRSASDLTYDGSNAEENRDIFLTKSLDLSFGLSGNALKGKRRCSDTSVYYNSPGRILLPPLKIPEEPTFHVCDKEQNTSKPISVGNGNLAKKTAKLKSFKDSMGNGSKPLDSGSSSQQFQLTGNSPGVSAQVFDDVLQVAKALSASACGDTGVNNRIDRLKRKINSSDEAWDEIRGESDPWVLARLAWGWLEELSEPLLCATDVELLLEGLDDPFASVKRLRKGQRHTFECLVTTASKLESVPEELFDRVLRRLAMVLTQCKSLSLTSRQESLDLAHALEGDGVKSRDKESVAYQLLLFLRTVIQKLRVRRDDETDGQM